MRYLILIALCAVTLGGCWPSCGESACEKRMKATLRAVVKAKHGCDEVKFLYLDECAYLTQTAKVNACGVVRVFQHGSWCEDCSYSWREIKKETQ